MIKEIFGKKIGMTQIFDSEGNLEAVSLVEVEPVCILEKVEHPNRTKVKIGCFKIEKDKIKKIKKPISGYFNKLGVDPYKLIREVEIEGTNNIEEKREIGIEIFNEGDIIDVRGKTKGRGFAGGMKRHGWAGQPASHGSTTHRRIGSAGTTTYPGRILRGHRMPGHMGNVFRTIKNLKILKIDKEKKLLLIKGAVPGSRGSIVKIKIQKRSSRDKR
ncbi:MAG TPA: 50S ribosomal protein L3 [Candidatus Omnitrophica bacterium]|nr:50S ribosomal protein L3 [Candidatus Omnitrophota bacterium]